MVKTRWRNPVPASSHDLSLAQRTVSFTSRTPLIKSKLSLGLQPSAPTASFWSSTCIRVPSSFVPRTISLCWWMWRSPEQTNFWEHLGHLLQFYKSYRRPLLQYTQKKVLDLVPSREWLLFKHAVAPVVDTINITITLAQLQGILLLVWQQKALVECIVKKISRMFPAEMGSKEVRVSYGNGGGEASKNFAWNVHGSLPIWAEKIVQIIHDEGWFYQKCNESFKDHGKRAFISHISA